MMARGELGAGHMADSYSRVTGQLGVLISSTGPGAANAVGGLVEARFAGTPLLHITGQSAKRFLERQLGTVHEVPDQLAMLRSVSKSAYRVRDAQQALGVLTRAVVEALTPPMGPVSVEVPIDVQRMAIERPAMLDGFELPMPRPAEPSVAALDELAQRVKAARRPMLWLGAGARAASRQAGRLLELGFGMVTSMQGRGVVDEDHPLNLGALNGIGSPLVESFYETADLLLVVGSRLRGHDTNEFALKLPSNLIQVDADPLANGRTYANRWFVCGDAARVLDGLVQRLEASWRADPGFAEEIRVLKGRAQAAYRDTLGPYADFPAQLRATMPRDAIWVRDVTISSSTWGHRLFPIHGPRDNVYPVGAGIGQGLALAIGAALGAAPRKTVVLTGDGGFFLNLGEFWTAIQERLDLVTIVMNDRGYGVIKDIQDALYGERHFYGDLLGPDLGKLASCAGVPFWRAASAEQFGTVCAQAMAHVGPSLIEVDMQAIGEYPAYFRPPASLRPT
jgi:acetolactate synthase-1/2/3 large subunit